MEFPLNEAEALQALKSGDPALAATAEAALWRSWCRSPVECNDLFRAGIEAMTQNMFEDAEAMFSRVIATAPEFAEAWNKRATVRYLMKNLSASISDCQETLARNPNHFGAASGQGLCHLTLGEYREAASCFRKALEIHPHLAAVRQNLALAEAEGGGGYLH